MQMQWNVGLAAPTAGVVYKSCCGKSEAQLRLPSIAGGSRATLK